MAKTFACPECETPVAAPAFGPGRYVVCAACGTLVELPYLTRPRVRWGRGLVAQWAWVLIVLGAAVAVVLGTSAFIRGKMREQRLRTIADLVAQAERDEQADRLREAVDRLTAAIGMAQPNDPGPRPDELTARRDRLAAELDRRRRADLERRAAADLAAADALLRAERPETARALDLCESAVHDAGEAGTATSDRLRDQARALAAAIIAAQGVVLAPVQGTFLDNDPSPTSRAAAELAKTFHPMVAGALTARGYLPRRDGSPLRDLWDAQAPFRLTTDVTETYAGTYLQGALRNSRIEMFLTLWRGPAVLWRARLVGQTRQPPPRMTALLAGRLAAATHRDPHWERRLYEDAVAHIAEQLPARFGNLPAWVGPPVQPPPSEYVPGGPAGAAGPDQPARAYGSSSSPTASATTSGPTRSASRS
jgi:hypothetical protein